MTQTCSKCDKKIEGIARVRLTVSGAQSPPLCAPCNDDLNQPFQLMTPDGDYYAGSLCGLLVQVLKHRLWHFLRGEGFRD